MQPRIDQRAHATTTPGLCIGGAVFPKSRSVKPLASLSSSKLRQSRLCWGCGFDQDQAMKWGFNLCVALGLGARVHVCGLTQSGHQNPPAATGACPWVPDKRLHRWGLRSQGPADKIREAEGTGCGGLLSLGGGESLNAPERRGAATRAFSCKCVHLNLTATRINNHPLP